MGLAGHGGLEIELGVTDRQVRGRVAGLLEEVQVSVGVARFAFRGLAEVAGDLRVALDVGRLGEIELAAVRLGLAREGVLQVAVGLGALQFLGHWGDFSFSLLLFIDSSNTVR